MGVKDSAADHYGAIMLWIVGVLNGLDAGLHAFLIQRGCNAFGDSPCGSVTTRIHNKHSYVAALGGQRMVRAVCSLSLCSANLP